MVVIKIIICDDHPLINEGLQRMVDDIDNMSIVGTAYSVAQLFEELQQKEVDVVLLDINLPDGDGAGTCMEIKQRFPHVKVLTVSSSDDRSTLLRVMRNGASGYLLKSASIDEIENAINLVFRGANYFSAEMQQLLTLILNDTDRDEHPIVTRREKEILQALKDGLNSQEIGEKLFISSLTVETHRKNLLAKFQVSKTINLLEKARELGLI